MQLKWIQRGRGGLNDMHHEDANYRNGKLFKLLKCKHTNNNFEVVHFPIVVATSSDACTLVIKYGESPCRRIGCSHSVKTELLVIGRAQKNV